MKIVILRDPRESAKKCSLIPLKERADVEFLRFERGREFDVGEAVLLAHDAPALSPGDRGKPLFVLDSSWSHLPELRRAVKGAPLPRSIPAGFVTAYPRKSKLYEDPSSGLASIEALFLATVVLGEPDLSLLKDYYWRAEFLKKNERALFLCGFQPELKGNS